MSEVESRSEINSLLIRYAAGIDTKNWKLLESCFAPDIVAMYGELTESREALMEFMVRRHSGLAWSLHRTTNILLDFDDETHAKGTAYFDALLSMSHDRGATVLKSVGYYDDEMERRDGVWMLTRRIVHGLYAENRDAAPYPPKS